MNDSNSTDRQRVIANTGAFVLLVGGVLSTQALVTLPILVTTLQQQAGSGGVLVDWLGGADLGGSALAALLMHRIVRRIGWRSSMLAAWLLVVAANLASIDEHRATMLLMLRLVAGLGNGAVLTIAFEGMCLAPHPERLFGAYTFAQILLQIALLAVLTPMIAAAGSGALYLGFTGMAILSAFLLPWIPRIHPVAGASAASGAPSRAAVIGLGAQALYFLGAAATWAWLEHIAHAFGLDFTGAGRALAIASLAGLAGAGAAALAGAGIRNGRALLACTVLAVLSTLALSVGGRASGYVLAVSLFSFAWNFGFPYQMGMLAVLDRGSGVAGLSLLAQLGALALGPVAGAYLVGNGEFGRLLLACAAAYVLSLLAFLAIDKTGRPG